jgi:hypothetical protein
MHTESGPNQCIVPSTHRAFPDLALDVIPLGQVGRHSMGLRLPHWVRRQERAALNTYIRSNETVARIMFFRRLIERGSSMRC